MSSNPILVHVCNILRLTCTAYCTNVPTGFPCCVSCEGHHRRTFSIPQKVIPTPTPAPFDSDAIGARDNDWRLRKIKRVRCHPPRTPHQRNWDVRKYHTTVCLVHRLMVNGIQEWIFLDQGTDNNISLWLEIQTVTTMVMVMTSFNSMFATRR